MRGKEQRFPTLEQREEEEFKKIKIFTVASIEGYRQLSKDKKNIFKQVYILSFLSYMILLLLNANLQIKT